MTVSSLASVAERAVKWSAVTTVARFVLQLGAQVALARLLGPDNYGVYGIGVAVLTLVTFVSGAAFSANLILLPEIDDEDIRFAFTWQLLIGSVCALGMYVTAPWLAVFFTDPRVEGMLKLLSLASFLMVASGPVTCLLQRDLDFRRLGLIQLASYGAGYLLVGVPMAVLGYGAYALGTAAVVQAALVLVGSYAVRPHPLRPLLSHHRGADTLSTGRIVLLTNVVNWFLGNMDRILIGRVLNAHAVGLYNVAYNLASIPSTLMVGTLQPTFLATNAKLQDDPQRMAQGWTLALSCVLVLATPAAVVFALLSSDLIGLLYGPAWADSAWVLELLFLCLPAWVSFGVSTPVLWNTGRKHLEPLLQLPLLAIALPAWWLAAPSGIRAIAIVSAAILFLRSAVVIAATLRALGLRWTVVAWPLGHGLALTVACSAAVLAGRQMVAVFSMPLLSLLAESLTSLAMLLFLVRVWPQLLGAEALLVLARVVPFARVPGVAPLAPASPEGLPR